MSVRFKVVRAETSTYKILSNAALTLSYTRDLCLKHQSPVRGINSLKKKTNLLKPMSRRLKFQTLHAIHQRVFQHKTALAKFLEGAGET